MRAKKCPLTRATHICAQRHVHVFALTRHAYACATKPANYPRLRDAHAESANSHARALHIYSRNACKYSRSRDAHIPARRNMQILSHAMHVYMRSGTCTCSHSSDPHIHAKRTVQMPTLTRRTYSCATKHANTRARDARTHALRYVHLCTLTRRKYTCAAKRANTHAAATHMYMRGERCTYSHTRRSLTRSEPKILAKNKGPTGICV